jgi:hypothetical protein
VLKARDSEDTGVIGASVTASMCVASPRCTVTPHEYSITDHRTVIVAGVASSVARTNSRVVALASRPRMTEPTGRLLACDELKIRNALLMATELIVTTWVPLVVFVRVPLCTPATRASKQGAEVNEFPPTDFASTKSAEVGATDHTSSSTTSGASQGIRRRARLSTGDACRRPARPPLIRIATALRARPGAADTATCPYRHRVAMR